MMRNGGVARTALFPLALLCAVAFTSLALGASANGNFPEKDDSYLVSRVDTTPGNNLFVSDSFFLWVRLKDGFADQISLNAIAATLISPLQLGFGLPQGRTLDREGEEYTYACHTEDGERKLVCKQLAHLEMNFRLGDLNDTFVSADLPYKLNVFGEDGADYIRSARGKDTLNGDSGNDILRSGAGTDTLKGGPDNDLLDGGDGADVMDCGEGNDRVQYQGRTSALTVTLDGVANDGASGENDTISNCENIEAWNGADTLTGSAGANKLDGRDGNDNIKGGGGSDRLSGGGGNDRLSGDAGNDTLYGDAGDDAINGGGGNDTVYGGDGNDTINVKDGVRDTVICGGGAYDAVVYDVGIDEIDLVGCERRN